MNFSQYDYFLIIDLEATCDDQDTIPRQEMETIEIGAVMVESEDLKPISEFQTFIKPVRHSILTDFCKQLTSITQEDVNHADTYPEAIKKFSHWLHQYDNFLFGSWGKFDRYQLQQDSKFHEIPYPIPSKHINLKRYFKKNQNLNKRYNMAEALELAGFSLQGTHHRGIDDARNIAKLMPYILGRIDLKISN